MVESSNGFTVRQPT